MASIKDVAKLAGVGLGTASRAMSGKGYVSPETRRKIEWAAKELRYTPNILAQNLLKNKSGIIGILIPCLEHSFYSRLVQCLEADLYKKGYKSMIWCTISQNHGEQDYLDMLEKNLVDGIITATHSLNDESYLESGRVIAAFDREFQGEIPFVRSDHEEAGRLAAEHFRKNGCKKVLSIYGADTRDGRISTGQAHENLRRRLEREKIQVAEVCTDRERFDPPYYRRLAKECLEKYRDADGIFASDLLALEFLFQALRKGKKIPEELKIISYDGTEITRSVYPRMSAVVQDIDGISKALTDILIERIETGKVSESRILPVKWQEGETCS